MASSIYYRSSESFGAIAAAFVYQSLETMIPWILAMGAVVTMDLISGLGKCLKLKVKIKISKFVRDSIAKFTTYFGFVVAACMIQTATNNEYEIADKCCMAVIAIEGISIFGNILKMKGYDLNFNRLAEVIGEKIFRTGKGDLEGLITKSEPVCKPIVKPAGDAAGTVVEKEEEI